MWSRAKDSLFPDWSDDFLKRLLLVLAAVMAIESMDRGSLGAVAPGLKRSLEFSNSRLGILVAAVALGAAIATLPAGALTDRTRRMRLLAGSLVLWSIAMGASAVVQSYWQLLGARVMLGVVLATATPVVASAIGDTVRDDKRGDAMAWIRTGELVGLGAGFLLVGVVTSMLSWRAVFAILAIIGLAGAWMCWRTDEPPRTGDDPDPEGEHRPIQREVREEGIEPGEHSEILEEDLRELSLWDAVKYALSIPSNRRLLFAELVGDFFLSGVATFAVVFVTKQYNIGQSTASLLLPIVGIGAIVGTIGGGRLSDWLITEKRVLAARLWVAGFGYLLAVAAFAPAIFLRNLYIALPFLIVAGVGLSASVPTVSAARLDVVVGTVWGRVEGVRTMIRAAAVAAAPLVVGFLSDTLADGGRRGMQYTIVLLLPLVVVNGIIVLRSTTHYTADVSAAAESVDRRRQNQRNEDPERAPSDRTTPR